jgi:Flp pilus assembly protein TadD
LDGNFFPAHEGLGFAYEQKGMVREAVEEFQLAVDLSGGSARALAALGHAYGIGGKTTKARHVLEQLRCSTGTRYVSSYDIALVYLGLGARERALDWLHKAFEERSPGMIWLKVEPRFDCLREGPSFQELLLRVRSSPSG